MVSTDVESLVFDLRLSSVVPGTMTGEDKDHSFTNNDLIMKLHYLRAVYYFKSDAAQGLHIQDLKTPMFKWLDFYYPTAGRIRRSEDNGRPFIKCNDSGVRIVEAKCCKSLSEWLGLNQDHSLDNHLICDSALGPDLSFTPLVFVQFTWFKCGGLSVGLNWAHVLGDVFTASSFINTWGQIAAGRLPSEAPKILSSRNGKCHIPNSTVKKPFSVKRLDDVGDHWVATTQSRMETYSFHFTAKQLNSLLSESEFMGQGHAGDGIHVQAFEILCGLVWKSLAKIRGEAEPRVVTICRNDSCNRKCEMLSNSQVIGKVEVDFSAAKADVLELAKLIGEKTVDETSMIEEVMDKHNGNADFTVYGACLSFVNAEAAKIYDLEIKGHKPVYANYSIGGVGDEGAVLVLPGPENGDGESLGRGRIVTVILPENQLNEFKIELRKGWGIY